MGRDNILLAVIFLGVLAAQCIFHKLVKGPMGMDQSPMVRVGAGQTPLAPIERK